MREPDLMTDRPNSPIHIHVDDTTPVHVHVKKQKKFKAATKLKNVSSKTEVRMTSNKADKATMASDEILPPPPPPPPPPPSTIFHQGVSRTQPQSRSPQHLGPWGSWVPPPAKSTRGSKYIYQGPNKRGFSPSKVDGDKEVDEELDTEDEERTLGKTREYERTIEGLMREIGRLKHEMEIQKAQKESEEKENVLSGRLREDLEKDQNIQKSTAGIVTTSNRSTLMKKLIEVEMHSQAVASESTRLQEAVKKRRDSNVLGHLREQFLERLAVLETSNRALRHVLRDEHESESSVLRLAEERDLLERKLCDAENILRNLESQLVRERAEADHLQQLLVEAKDKSEQDKDSLKRAARAQKERVSEKETALEKVNREIIDHQSIIRELHAELSSVKTHKDVSSQEAKHSKAEVSRLKVQIQEMEEVFEQMAVDSKHDLESKTLALRDQMSELTELRLENERLQTSHAICEEKLCRTEEEMSRCREIARDYEDRLDEYRREVHSSLQPRLDELAPLPDLLRKTEIRLQERTEELERMRRNQADYDRQIKDMRHQMENQFDLESQRRDLLLRITEKEEAFRQINLQLQELMRENLDLQRQMETATATEHRMIHTERQKGSAKDRAYQSQILDLESQINNTRNEIARVKREKEETERKFRTQLIEVQGKLERCENTKRSLQNYIEFIQTSYTTTFGDSLATSPCTSRSPYTTSSRRSRSPYTTSSRRSPFI